MPLHDEDSIELDKHWTASLKGGQTVSDQVKAPRNSLPPGKSRNLIKQFATTHVAMGVGCRKGHDMFVAASLNPTVSDKIVVRVGREPVCLLDEAAQKIAKESIAAPIKTAEATHTTLVVNSTLILVVLGLGLADALIFSRITTKSFVRAVDMVSAVSHGDLAKPFDLRSSDETGQSLHALKQIQINLTNVVNEMRQNAGKYPVDPS